MDDIKIMILLLYIIIDYFLIL